MLAAPLSAVLVAALLPVVAWCAYSVVRRPSAGTHDHVPADVELWHGVMGAGMVLLLGGTVSEEGAWLGSGLFVALVVWCVVRGAHRAVLGHYWRLGIMSLSMAAMMVPSGTASAATAEGGTGTMTDMSAHMAGMAMTTPRDEGLGILLSGPAALAVGLTMIAVAIAAGRHARQAPGVRSRLSAGCEVVMASAMALMALAMV